MVAEATPSIRVGKDNRLWLRLANTANSLVMPLALPAWDAWFIALDGMPVHEPLRVNLESVWLRGSVQI